MPIILYDDVTTLYDYLHTTYDGQYIDDYIFTRDAAYSVAVEKDATLTSGYRVATFGTVDHSSNYKVSTQPSYQLTANYLVAFGSDLLEFANYKVEIAPAFTIEASYKVATSTTIDKDSSYKVLTYTTLTLPATYDVYANYYTPEISTPIIIYAQDRIGILSHNKPNLVIKSSVSHVIYRVQ